VNLDKRNITIAQPTRRVEAGLTRLSA